MIPLFGPSSCKVCKMFESSKNSKNGLCHLNPPQLIVLNNELHSLFPGVDEDLCCAQFVRAEINKLAEA